jgi:hypothetical protein
MPDLPPPEMVGVALEKNVLPPALAAAGVLMLFLLSSRGRAAVPGVVLGLAAALAVWNYLTETLPWVPAHKGYPWLLAVAVVCLQAEALTRYPGVPWWLAWPLRSAVAVGAAWLLVSDAPPLPDDPPKEWWESAPALAAVILLGWLLLDRLGSASAGSTVPLTVAVALFGAGTVLIHAGSARLTDVALAAAGGFTGLAAVAWPWRADTRAAAGAGAALLPGLLLSAKAETFSEVPWTSFVLPAVAPLLVGLTAVGPLRRLPWFLRWPLRAALLLAPLAAAVHLAAAAAPLDMESLQGGEADEGW